MHVRRTTDISQALQCSWHAQKECKYTDANGRPIPAPNGSQRSQSNTSPEPYPDHLNGPDDDFQLQHFQGHPHGIISSPPEAGPSVVPSSDVLVQPKKRTRQDNSIIGNAVRPNDGGSSLTVERDALMSLDDSGSILVTRELVNRRSLQLYSVNSTEY